MKKLATVLAVLAVAGSAVGAHAGDADQRLRKFHEEAARARAQGGYGNPVTEVPKALGKAAGDLVTWAARQPGKIAAEISGGKTRETAEGKASSATE